MSAAMPFAALVHATKPECVCGGRICAPSPDSPLLRRYTCPCCRRFVPWCFGADDDMPELCDDCRQAVSKARERRQAEHMADLRRDGLR